MTDILIDINTAELQTRNGDFLCGNPTEQNVVLLLATNLGEWRQYPQTGIGLSRELTGTIDRFLERNIRVQLEADGFKLSGLKINEQDVQLTGEYEL